MSKTNRKEDNMTKREEMGVIGYFLNDDCWRGGQRLSVTKETITQVCSGSADAFKKLSSEEEVNVIGLDGNLYRVRKSEIVIMSPGEEWEI